MNLPQPFRRRWALRHQRGMTLIEMMFTVALMTMVIAAVMSANFLGWREENLLETKAGANDSSRQAVNQLMYDIRAAKGFDIGTYAGTNFTAIKNGILQGNSVKLYTIVIGTNQVVDPNRYTLYYFDSSQAAANNGMLWCRSSTNANATLVVSNLINTLYFTSEDYWGRTQSVRTFKGVVHATLQFSQFLYPLTSVGSNQLYDYYRIECRATPHIPDGP